MVLLFFVPLLGIVNLGLQLGNLVILSGIALLLLPPVLDAIPKPDGGCECTDESGA